uniref:Putative type III restriction enzyme n=1 Tax=viral metagenome TaxID=1070528 RepID=A0A6M3KND2_9ZZZZ
MEKQIVINQLNPVFCQVQATDAIIFAHCLEYPKVFYKKSRSGFGKTRIDYSGDAFFSKKGPVWTFWSGLLPRIKRVCNGLGYPLNVIGEEHWNNPLNAKPKLSGITFRSDQSKMIEEALSVMRGTLLAPTGSGKTILIAGLTSCNPEKTLILADKKTAIVEQTFQEFKKFGFDVGMYTGDSHLTKFPKVTIATKQSIINHKLEPDEFSMVIIDEVHHLSNFKSEYAKILSQLLAPLRFGFTATYPGDNKREAQLAIESFIGPVISNLSIEEAAKMQILAIPKIKIIREPYSRSIHDLRTWADVHEIGIVNSEDHNFRVAQEAVTEMDEKKSVLIFVNHIEHAINIKEIIATQTPDLKFHMVHSSIGTKLTEQIKELTKVLDNFPYNKETLPERNTIADELILLKTQAKRLEENSKRQMEFKEKLIKKEIDGVVATSTWREGINIPSLDTIILAAGGKEIQKIIQEIGRGLRKTNEKDFVKIIDFFNPSHRFLIEHFGHRLCEYLDRKWQFIYE